MSSSEEQFSEYQNQLSELNALLEEDPNDESVLQLKHDLLELIRLTKSGESAAVADVDDGVDDGEEKDAGVGMEQSVGMNGGYDDSGNAVEGASSSSSSSATATIPPASSTTTTSSTTTATTTTKKSIIKKKSKTKPSTTASTTFEIPTHLIPLDSDTAAEKNRKRRTIKALKSKFREKQKQKVSEQKQKSWQDFTTKKNKKKGVGGAGTGAGGKSIFATEEGVHAKVGVISGGSSGARRVTEFGERRRHK